MTKAYRRFYEIWGDTDAQNSLLRLLVVVMASLLILSLLSLTTLALRRPPLYVVSDHLTSEIAAKSDVEVPLEAEIKRAMLRYAALRMNWTPATFDDTKSQILELVAKESRQKFGQSQNQMAQTIKAKNMSQKFFIDEVKVELNEHMAILSGSRVVEVDGVRAVVPGILKVQFAYGDRNKTNPEGVYIVSEDLSGADSVGPR